MAHLQLVSFLVTFNVGDFDAARKFALPVLTPAVFLQQLNQGEN